MVETYLLGEKQEENQKMDIRKIVAVLFTI